MTKKIKKSHEMVDGLRESMAELDGYLKQGMTLDDITRHIKKHHPERVSVVFIPSKPGNYPPSAVLKLRKQLALSQPAFAEAIGVSAILVQSWERGVRTPSRLACRLLDIISKDPAAWMASLRPITKRASRRAG